MLNQKEEDRLLHDVKRLAIGIGLIAKEIDEKKREYLAQLLDAELNRLTEDIEDLIERNGDN